MEFEDELDDLVVLLDVDKNKYSDEYEVLQDLITIEDEGIMDISYKLQQKDFDEYVSSLQKDTAILPQSFCRINQNIKLLNRCRPLTIQVVDCKKFKIFYNNKLAEDLKTRENFSDKFKDILSEKDDDISDDDTIELDVDIADEIEMEDLIRFDNVQENGREDEQMKCVNNEDTWISRAKEVNSNIMNQTKKDNFSHDDSFLFDSPKTVNLFDPIDCGKKSTKKVNTKKPNISKSSKQTKNNDRLLDKLKYSTKKKDKKKNNHTKSIQLNIEMQKKIADMLTKVEELKNNYYSKKFSKKPLDYSNNTLPLNNSNVCHNQMNNINLLPNYATRPQMYEWHQENYVNMHPLAAMQVGRSILHHSNLPIVASPYAQIPYYYNNINKAFMPPPKQVSSNSNLHFALQNNNLKKIPDKTAAMCTKPRSLSSINFMKPHLQKLAKANDNPRSIKIRPVHNYGLSASVKQQEIGRPTLNVTTSLQNSYQDKIIASKIMNVNTHEESNLNSNNIVTNKHPTVVKILQNGIAQDNKQVNYVPENKIIKKSEVKILQHKKYSVNSTSFHPHEIQEFRRKMFLYENNPIPQRIPTLQNRQIVEPSQVFPKPQNSPECTKHESAIQNVTEPVRIPIIRKTDQETQKLLPQSVKIEAQKNSPKHDYKFQPHTQKIIEEPIKKEDAKKETKSTVGEEKLKTPSFVKLPAQGQSPKNNIISPYQSPVQCVKVEIHQSSPKIVKKRKVEEYSKIEVKKKEVSEKLAQPAKLSPNPLESTAKKAENLPKTNTTHGSPASRSLSKVSKKEYSPPVLPIPTFKKTFEMLAKVNLISKYKYKRSRHIFEYAMLDEVKMLSNKTITKDLEWYFSAKEES